MADLMTLPRTDRLSLRAPPEALEQLRAIAEAARMSQADWVLAQIAAAGTPRPRRRRAGIPPELAEALQHLADVVRQLDLID